jgi:hypothetical protein
MTATVRKPPTVRLPLLVDASLALGLGAALWVLAGPQPGSDQYSAALWGEQIVHGRLPDYAHGPTPHPLITVVAALAAAVSHAAPDVLAVIGLLSLGALAAGVFRLGTELFSLPVGLAGFAIVATRPKLIGVAAVGYPDIGVAALLVWAAVLESRGRRGAPVLVLLAAAGLLRPEAWVLSAAYLLWISRSVDRGRLPGLAGLAAAAPVIWIVSDLVVTGDPLWSLTRTGEITAALGSATGLPAAIDTGYGFLRGALGRAVAVAAVGGIAIAAWRERRRALAPAALLALNLGMWTAVGIGGLALEQRFLTLAVAMLSFFAALCMFAWTAVERRAPGKGVLQVAGALALALVLITIPQQARSVENVRVDLAAKERASDDLRSLVSSPSGREAIARCDRIGLVHRRMAPAIATWAGLSRIELVSPDDRRPGSRAYLYPRTTVAETVAGAPAPRARPPVLASSEQWALRGRC